MGSSSYKIVSFLKNKSETEKISYIFDKLNERVIEKWESFQLLNDNSKYVITNRYIYIYNKNSILYKIIEIEKGSDNRDFSYLNDNNEYCHSINRNISNKLSVLRDDNKAEIIYTRTNNLSSNPKKHFQRSLQIELDKSPYRKNVNIRLNYLLLRNGKIYTYQYCKENFNELLNIIEWKILIDLRIINKIIKLIGIPLLMTIPDLFIKRKVNIKSVKSIYKAQKVNYSKQDYFSDIFEDYVFINEIILNEDLFINEQKNLMTEYEDECSLAKK